MFVFYWSFYSDCGACVAIWFSSSGIVQTSLEYRYWNNVFALHLDHAIISFNINMTANTIARMEPTFSNGSSAI